MARNYESKHRPGIMLVASHLLGKSSEVMFDFAPEYAKPEAFLYAAKHWSQLWAS